MDYSKVLFEGKSCGFTYCENAAEQLNTAEYPDGKVLNFLLCEYHAMASYRWYANDVHRFIESKSLITVD